MNCPKKNRPEPSWQSNNTRKYYNMLVHKRYLRFPKKIQEKWRNGGSMNTNSGKGNGIRKGKRKY